MSELAPGTVIDGKYRVERDLGTGGMGYVVAARHMKLDQVVALKFMRPGVLENDEAKARFYREAKASARLRSEHVARVLDVGTLESGDPYMVMEYLEGKDLSVIARERGSMSVAEAADLVIQACDALAEAHAHGIVHRDIKLANLFVQIGAGGIPHLKVLDFGISKASPFGSVDVDVTTTAAMLGSPRFMSPEQMRDPRDVDARSDVWSLGVILYRLTAGRAPFDSETLGRLFSMVMHEVPPPIRAIAPQLPIAFEMLVMHCLVKEREGRVQNVAELAHGLVPFTSNPQRAAQIAEKASLVLSLPPGASANNSGGYPAGSTGRFGVVSGMPGTASQSGPYGMQMMASSGPGSSPSYPRRPSGPPGASETGGEGAAWGATNARNRPKKSSRGPLIATLALLTGAFALGGLAIHAKYMQSSTSAGQPQAAQALPDLPRMDIPGVSTGAPPRETELPSVPVDTLPRVDNLGKLGPISATAKPPATSGNAMNDKPSQPSLDGRDAREGRVPSSTRPKSAGATRPTPARQTGVTGTSSKPPEDSSSGIPNSRD